MADALLGFFKALRKFIEANLLLWQEALLVDFLQKKGGDRLVRSFLISAAYLFNERFLFDRVSRPVLDFILGPVTRFSVFDFKGVALVLFFTLLLHIALFLAVCLGAAAIMV